MLPVLDGVIKLGYLKLEPRRGLVCLIASYGLSSVLNLAKRVELLPSFLSFIIRRSTATTGKGLATACRGQLSKTGL